MQHVDIYIVAVTSSWRTKDSQGSREVALSLLMTSQSSYQTEYVCTHQGSACMVETQYT